MAATEEITAFVGHNIGDGFGVDYDFMLDDLVKPPNSRFGAWLGSDRGRIDQVLQYVKSLGISPEFFAAHELAEGYNPSWGWWNNTVPSGDPMQDAAATVAWAKDTATGHKHQPAWQDPGGGGPTIPIPQEVINAGEAEYATFADESIGQLYAAGTAAATWALWYPQALSASVNGVRDYANPLQDCIDIIKFWKGTINGSDGKPAPETPGGQQPPKEDIPKPSPKPDTQPGYYYLQNNFAWKMTSGKSSESSSKKSTTLTRDVKPEPRTIRSAQKVLSPFKEPMSISQPPYGGYSHGDSGGADIVSATGGVNIPYYAPFDMEWVWNQQESATSIWYSTGKVLGPDGKEYWAACVNVHGPDSFNTPTGANGLVIKQGDYWDKTGAYGLASGDHVHMDIAFFNSDPRGKSMFGEVYVQNNQTGIDQCLWGDVGFNPDNADMSASRWNTPAEASRDGMTYLFSGFSGASKEDQALIPDAIWGAADVSKPVDPGKPPVDPPTEPPKDETPKSSGHLTRFNDTLKMANPVVTNSTPSSDKNDSAKNDADKNNSGNNAPADAGETQKKITKAFEYILDQNNWNSFTDDGHPGINLWSYSNAQCFQLAQVLVSIGFGQPTSSLQGIGNSVPDGYPWLAANGWTIVQNPTFEHYKRGAILYYGNPHTELVYDVSGTNVSYLTQNFNSPSVYTVSTPGSGAFLNWAGMTALSIAIPPA